MRVAVLGAGGRMGAEVCRAVSSVPDLELVAAVDPGFAGATTAQVVGVDGPRIEAGIEALGAQGAETAVDFTEARAAMGNLRWCASNGVHAVVGTTGFDAVEIDELRHLFGVSEGPNCVVAPNFAIGAVLMAHLAAVAALYMDSAEVVEAHHDAKRDAPSGTALQTAGDIASARQSAGLPPWPPDPTEREVVAGTRGGVGPGGTRIHSLRMRGLVAHHEVVLGAPGQSLTIRHDSYDRTCFMPGVLLAVRSVTGRRGLTVGLGPLLGLSNPSG